MTRLTEEMVIARTRQSDLSTIKKLNCWGSDLSDVSIIKRMRQVEVLALSVNKINGLSDFENCQQLKELYLRKNNIQDINEIAYLQGLPELKHLWLEENPCVDKAGPGYRGIVLRALPNLKKLDNIDVTPEEVTEAQRGGGNVIREEIFEETVYEPPSPQQQSPQQQHPHQQQQQQQQWRTSSPVRERSPPNQEMYSPQETNHPPSPSYQRDHRRSYHQYDRSPCSDQDSPLGGYRERVPIAPSISTHSMKEYYQSDYHKPPPSQYRHSQMDLTEWAEENGHGGRDSHQNTINNNLNNNNNGNNRRSNGGGGGDRDVPGSYQYRNGTREEWDDSERRRETPKRGDGRFSDTASVVSNAVLNHYASYHRRPVNRNSNLLSATLCLVKELDYPSLEVVEHAVRCRIDELSND